MTSSSNHYELLGISSSSDDEVIRKAFHKLSKELHPDTTLLPQEEAAQRFHQVCEAYELLTDPSLRKAYDLHLSERHSQSEILNSKSDVFLKNYFHKKNLVGDRRPFSGGELFSLLLLGLTILVSLCLAIGFGIVQGRDLMIRPTWLSTLNSQVKIPSFPGKYDFITTYQDSFKSTFFKSY
mgnify:CR=1 FL=1